jgi:hypothetical protein
LRNQTQQSLVVVGRVINFRGTPNKFVYRQLRRLGLLDE